VTLHPAAEGFARSADVYERARPEYPPQAVIWLADRLGLRAGRVVVDVAAGTGKLTRLLVPTGARVVAVEPQAEMLAVLRQVVPEAEALEGAAEALPLADGAADAVTAASAFHWFQPGRALPEIARVLRPDGRLAIVFNTRDPEDELQRELTELLRPHGVPISWMRDRDHLGTVAASGLFEPPEYVEFRHEQRFDAERLVERVSSISYVALLPDEERGDLLARVRELGERRQAPFAFPYVTQIWVAGVV
jgi:SAM-dependent methyltransferase